LPGSAALTALTVTVEGDGTLDGAVYRPVEVIVPTVELPPARPFASQVTWVLVEPETFAVNWTEFRIRRLTTVGDIVTETCVAPLTATL
jgi:hypothetical protein